MLTSIAPDNNIPHLANYAFLRFVGITGDREKHIFVGFNNGSSEKAVVDEQVAIFIFRFFYAVI